MSKPATQKDEAAEAYNDAAFKDDGGGDRIPARTNACGINYTAAFVLLAAGVATLREISLAWGVDYRIMSERAMRENWSGLLRRHGHNFMRKENELRPRTPEEAEKKVRKIEENRSSILKTASGLMAQIQKALDESTVTMDSKTVSELARAVKMLGEIAMLANGDEYVLKGGGGAVADNARKNSGMMIQINIPTIIAGPRKKQDPKIAQEKQAELIEEATRREAIEIPAKEEIKAEEVSHAGTG